MLRNQPEPQSLTSNCEETDFNNKKKINIISDVVITPAIRDLSDNETVHSAIENPIIEVPISEKALNTYKNQVVIHSSRNITDSQVKTFKPYDKLRITVSLPENNLTTHILNFIKTNFDSKQIYALHFKTKNLDNIFIKTIQKYFKLKLIKTNLFLQDLIDLEEQKYKIKYHHEGKTCHKGIVEIKNSLSRHYYWPNIIKDITNYVNTCKTCQVAKYKKTVNN